MDTFWPKKAQTLSAWLLLIVNGLLPFSFCENECARQCMKQGPISRKTLMKYLNKLTVVVEKKITEMLPEKFAIVFDGWSSRDNTHYMAIFVTFPAENELGYSKILLTMSPMGDEDSLSSQEHYDFATYILKLYHKSWENVVCLVGDNCNTNKALADLAHKPLLGCASHRFNLAVKDILEEYSDVTSCVYHMMKKLKNIIPAAKLRKLTPLRAKCANATRWSSTYKMLRCYKQLKEFLPKLNMTEVDDLLPSNC